MSTCWKCQRELPEGQIECEYGCPDEKQDIEFAKRLKEHLERMRPVDWDKVQTLDDIKLLLKTISIWHVDPQVHPELKKFLKEKGEA